MDGNQPTGQSASVSALPAATNTPTSAASGKPGAKPTGPTQLQIKHMSLNQATTTSSTTSTAGSNKKINLISTSATSATADLRNSTTLPSYLSTLDKNSDQTRASAAVLEKKTSLLGISNIDSDTSGAESSGNEMRTLGSAAIKKTSNDTDDDDAASPFKRDALQNGANQSGDNSDFSNLNDTDGKLGK
jgi:hypothetical protein